MHCGQQGSISIVEGPVRVHIALKIYIKFFSKNLSPQVLVVTSSCGDKNLGRLYKNSCKSKISVGLAPTSKTFLAQSTSVGLCFAS